MKRERRAPDITVVGGGLAGVCAAVAAARMGRTVGLVQNRPVLGGNSSSEVRVWVVGATAHGARRFARETGIMGELFLENEYANPEGNPYLWDLVVLDAVKREPNIELFLNTDVRSLERRDDGAISSVTGWQMGAERELTFSSPLFLDCTGDGLVGFLAGAEHRVGREARAEYGEDWAPEAADDYTLGSTILFYTKDAGRPVPFVPPSFAVPIEKTSIPRKRIVRAGANGCDYWWIEWGGELDTIHDNERIRDELWGVVYGIWDHIKNSGRFPEAQTMTLEWVGAVPGKRESRRFLGDYVLRQQDIIGQAEFEDACAFGGWSIDLHPPQGVYSYETASKHLYSDGIYQIPYRCLYSRNVSNLLFAGRNVSASHVAFGSTRVMATCATLGEAAGTAAALCLERSVSPRGLYLEHRQELVQTLLRRDASVLGVRNEDAVDLARSAALSASSFLERVQVLEPSAAVLLEGDIGLVIPVEDRLESVSLLLTASEATDLELEVWSTGRPQNHVPYSELARASARVEPGGERWVEVPFGLAVEGHLNLFLVARANPRLSLHLSGEPLTGVLGFRRQEARDQYGNPLQGRLRAWNPRPLHRTPPCVRLEPPGRVYAPEVAVNGWVRPYGGPNAWVSQPLAPGREEWLELRWDEPTPLREVLVTFNDDLNEDFVNLHHHRSPWRVVPELVRDYRLEGCANGHWTMLERVVGNRRRRRAHQLEAAPLTAVRLVVEATNGGLHAEVLEVRAYT